MATAAAGGLPNGLPTETPPAAVTPPPIHSSLYVGDLDRDVEERSLFELFSQVGPVMSIRVCRDAVTRRSLGYAYVNYNSGLDPQAAERALDTLNYTPLGGKPLRIMWSHRDPAFRKSGVGNIYIKNLDKGIDNKALHDTFTQFGHILSCKVAMDHEGESKGYGFVHFEKEESAQTAIEKVNGMLLEGKKVYVGPFLKRSDRPADKDVRFTNVFVKNLAESVDDPKLHEMFAAFGEVTSAIVMKDEKDVSKGFGFVNFEESEPAHAAVEALNGKDIDGKELYVGRAQKKSERQAELRQKHDDIRQERSAKYQGMNLYVKNLVDEVDDAQLRTEFAPFGTITSARVMRDEKGKSKGFGFVCYTSPDEATRAVTEMHNRMLHGKPVYVALAQRRDERRAQLETSYQRNIPAAVGPVAPRGPTANGPLAPMFGGPGGPPGPMGPMGFYPGAMGPQPPRGPGGPGGMGPGMYGPRMFDPRFGAPPAGGRGGRSGPPNGFMNPMVMPQGAMPVGPGRGGRGRGRGGRGGRFGPGGPSMEDGVFPMPGPGPMREGGDLTTAMLAAAPPEQQKQMLGERLFPLVSRRQPELAGKITGMLLEMDNSELLVLLDSPEALDGKVHEAIEVLKQHGALPETINNEAPAENGSA
ncbi:hypothetical protein WJX84_004454 [Apatococcus fuscideae]|uniref:Polyadenylate-binding protein n=1 Tax=Apatococcus fuscideae TaxID=2026836 RepID=A0AAW1ST42_9CHLO